MLDLIASAGVGKAVCARGSGEGSIRAPMLRCFGPAASVPLQDQFIDLHDPQHSLGIDVGLPSAFCCRFTKRVMRRYP